MAKSRINKIKRTSGRDQIIQSIYNNHKKECTYWLMKKYGLVEEDASDVFQNTLIVVFDKITNHNLDLSSIKLRSYLFAVAKNKALEYLRSLDKFESEEYLDKYEYDTDCIKEKEIIELKMSEISRGMIQLSPCSRNILQLFYSHHKSIPEITEIMGYKNHETTKNMKYKSLKKLRRIVLSDWNSNESCRMLVIN